MADKIYRIGCQSWGYDDWVTPLAGETVFYPRGTKKTDMLGVYSEIFDTVEVDATLYGVPAATTIEMWRGETTPSFTLSLKFPREITHDLLLRGRSLDLAREFIASGELLGSKLGIFLIQFPPSFEATRDDAAAFRRFLAALPTGHRFAVEFRHPSWFVDWTFDELQSAGVALCLVEGKWIEQQTMFDAARHVKTPFRYVRLFGERDLERFDRVYRDRSDVVAAWSDEIGRLDAEEIFIYVDNYLEGFAPATANKFRAALGLAPADFARLESQASLF